MVNSACSRLTCSLFGRRWQVSPRPILNFGPIRGMTFPSGFPRTTTSCTFMRTVPTPEGFNDKDQRHHQPGLEHPAQSSGLDRTGDAVPAKRSPVASHDPRRFTTSPARSEAGYHGTLGAVWHLPPLLPI